MDDPAREATGQLGAYAYRADTRDRSATDVLKDIVGNVQEIIRSEVRLAKIETTAEVRKAGAASTVLLASAVVGLYAAGFVLLAIVHALSLVMAYWLASLVVGLVLAITAAVLFSTGLSRWKEVSPKPEKTVETVKENVEWMKNQTRS